MAAVAGVFLAIDLALWHESIALIGIGLATVIANVQIVFVALAGWMLYGERLSAKVAGLIAFVAVGLALTSGLARPDAYGAAPLAGAVYGVLAGVCYSGFLLVFRTANRSLASAEGPLLDATFGVVLGTLIVAPFDPAFTWRPPLDAHVWLAILALVSQVAGWLLITTALPRLPVVETSVLLLLQPVFSVVWGVLFFAERLSDLQWTGTLLVLAGVGALTWMRSAESVRLAAVDNRA
jgi:drug/metabolite transporter (DMT)-like permease